MVDHQVSFLSLSRQAVSEAKQLFGTKQRRVSCRQGIELRDEPKDHGPSKDLDGGREEWTEFIVQDT